MRDSLDNDSLLLLYLAGELSDEQRAAVDQRLAAEPALREALGDLSESQSWLDSHMAGMDGRDEIAPTVASAVTRRTTRAMRQWQAEQLARRPAIVAPPRRTLPFGWRSYSAAAVAAGLFVALLVWWGNQDDPNNRKVLPDDSLVADVGGPVDDSFLDSDLAQADVPADPDDERLALTWGSSLDFGPADSDPGQLNNAERQMRDLAALGRGDGSLMGM